MVNWWVGTTLAVAVASVCITGGALAQQTTPLPGSAEPGRIDERFQPGVPEPLSQPGETPAAEDQVAPEGAAQQTFVLTGVTVENSTVFAPGDFQPLFADMIGQSVSLADIYTIANQATAVYRNAGYILSRVVVPPQDIIGGVVTLQAVEGYVDQVTVEGDIGGDVGLIEAYGEKIRAARPLNASDLERYLLLAGDLAGAEARGVLSPSATVPGASDLAIVMEHDPFDAFAAIDNRGSRFVGEWIGTAGVGVNSVLGQWEEFNVTAATSSQFEELAFGEFAATLPITSEGTTLTWRNSYSFSEPGDILKPNDVDSRAWRFSLEASHPYIRSRTENLFVGAVLEWNHFKSTTQGATFSNDDLRVLRLSGTYDFVDDLLGVNLIRGELSQGVPWLGATESDDPNKSRAEGSGTFTKLQVDLQRLQRIAPGLNVLFAASGQVANTALLASEEFGVGGAAFGRGYNSSEIIGDHGLSAKVELQYGRSVENYLGVLNSYQVYGFYDTGIVWNIEQPEGAVGGSHDTLNSVGAGLRLNVLDDVSVNLEVAHRIGRENNIDNLGIPDTRGFLSVIARF
ncbi:MAG: ShlB/FhaC/HecB family hemolysin secretion/activation protein [Alphaproteobacteria bacterium]